MSYCLKLVVILTLLFSQTALASDGEADPENVPLVPVAQAPVPYVTPPSWALEEFCYEVPDNVSPEWRYEHRVRVRSSCYKLSAGLIAIGVYIGVVVLIGLHEGPLHLFNFTNPK